MSTFRAAIMAVLQEHCHPMMPAIGALLDELEPQLQHIDEHEGCVNALKSDFDGAIAQFERVHETTLNAHTVTTTTLRAEVETLTKTVKQLRRSLIDEQEAHQKALALHIRWIAELQQQLDLHDPHPHP